MPGLVVLVLLGAASVANRPALAGSAEASEGAMLAALAQGNLPAARAVLEQRVARGPQSPRHHWLLGRVLFLHQDYSAAAERFSRAAGACPQASAIHYWRGRALGEQARRAPLLQRPGLARRTLAAFRRAVALDGGNVPARLALLHYHLRAPAVLGGSRREAREQVEAIQRLEPLSAYRARALVRIADGEYDRARTLYRDARRAFPASPLPLFWLAELQRSRQAPAAALALYRELALWSPPQPRAWYEFAVTAEALGQHRAEAVEWLQRYLDEPLGLDAVAPTRVRQLLGRLQAEL